MILLDTVRVTLLNHGHPRIAARVLAVPESVAVTIVSRIEILRGRWDFLLKAADGRQLQRAQQLLLEAEEALSKYKVIFIEAAAAAEFDRLREDKKLKKIGRADLLITSIALANRAMLVTRNLKHFRLVGGLPLENGADE
jgi:tRNA(fMet)-specific endonuclease VapC